MARSLFRIVAHFKQSGSVVVNNTFHVYTDLSPPFCSQICADFVTNIWAPWRSHFIVGLVFEGVSAQRMIPDLLDSASQTSGEAGGIVLGSGNANLRAYAPSNLALVVTWRSQFPGRSGRGRTYLCGQILASNDSLHWHPDQITGATAVAETVFQHYKPFNNPMGLGLCVFSRKAGGRVPPYSDVGIQPVQSYTVQSVYATMGSRRLGHGI